MTTMFWIWLAAAVVFLILELATPALLFSCFTVGAVVAGIYSYFYPDAYYWQSGLFLSVSIVLLPFARALAKKLMKPSAPISNVDALIGQTAIVTRAIDNESNGQVRIEGETWRAVADRRIEERARVRIVRVSGTKLHVEPLIEERSNS